jgi:flagellar biosynthetic protein FliO
MTTMMQNACSVAVGFSLYATAACASSDVSSADGGGLTSLFVALILVAGAAVAATWVLRHWKGSVARRQGPLQLVHVIAVGPRERLALVKIGGRYLVVGITPASITRVAELSDIQDNVTEPEKDNVQDIFTGTG